MLHRLQELILSAIVNTPHIARNYQKVYRKKGSVKKDIGQHEMDLTKRLVHQPAEHFREPVIDRGEEGEDNPSDDVVEVSDDVVSIVDENVDGRRGHENSAEAADQEVRDKAKGEQHRRGETDGATPERSQP